MRYEIVTEGNHYVVKVGAGSVEPIEIAGFKSHADASSWVLEFIARMIGVAADSSHRKQLAAAAFLKVPEGKQ